MPKPEYKLVAGKLCLDFANTEDKLASYADLVAFARQAGIASVGEAATLLAAATRRPTEAGRILVRARALRRWCDMGDCGNRAKARSFYRRQKKKAKPVSS
jgi:hypothetical protein